MNNCWRTLPEDLIDEIILFVSGCQNIYKLSLCCKKFSHKLNLSLYQAFIKRFAKVFGHSRAMKIFDDKDRINTTFVTGMILYDKLTFKLLLCGIRQMKNLQSLQIHSYTSFEQQDILKKLWLELGLDLKNLYLQKSKTQRHLLFIAYKKEKAEKEKKLIIEYISVCFASLYLACYTEKYFNIHGGVIFGCFILIYIFVRVAKISFV